MNSREVAGIVDNVIIQANRLDRYPMYVLQIVWDAACQLDDFILEVIQLSLYYRRDDMPAFTIDKPTVPPRRRW